MNLALMRLIGRILRSDQRFYDDNSTRPRPAAALRLLGAILCILLCAISRNAWFTLTVIAVELARVCMKPAKEIAHILRPVLLAVVFAAVFTLPAVVLGSPGSFGNVTMKVAESVLVLSVLNEEVSWKETTGALTAFHLPEVFIITLDSTIRFLVILGRFSNTMLEAVSLRRVGRKQWRNAGTGGILGTTFLKSQQMAQETSEAMICRGFTGEVHGRTAPAPGSRKRLVNAAYCGVYVLLAAGFWYTQRLI